MSRDFGMQNKTVLASTLSVYLNARYSKAKT